MEGTPRARAVARLLIFAILSELLVACGGGAAGGGSVIPSGSSTGSRGTGPGGSVAITLSTLPVEPDTSGSTSGVFIGADCGGQAIVSCPNFAPDFRHGIALGTIYAGWSDDLGSVVQGQNLALWSQQGIVPQITWMPGTGVTYDAINQGTYDSYITTSAQELKAFGSTIFLRPFHEFNGDWYPYGLANQGADSAADTAFINAWRRVYTIFQQQGATNVKFVWCYAAGSSPSAQTSPWNNPANAYPGDAYVDWIAFDAYNRGSLTDGLPWNSFDQIMNAPYQLAISISTSKPIMVAEMASNEYGDGGNQKASWIAAMIAELTSASNPYPNLKLISWFEGDPNGYIYNNESTQPAYNAWVNGLRATDPNGAMVFRSNGAALAAVTTP